MAESYQAGVRPTRLEWVEETTVGEAPADPSWEIFSDNWTSAFDWEPDANTQRQNGAGEITAQGFFNGSETHDLSFTYDLQRWPYTAGGDIQDISGYFLEPASDNSLKATQTIVGWSEQADGGANGEGRYIVTVAKGCHPDSLTMPFETEDGSPISTETSFQASKIRQYDLQQPPSGGSAITVNNGGTTSVDVTVENYDASTQETVTVAGGGSSTTTATFSSLGAVELDTDTDGDVTVEDASANTLATIKGSDSYPAGEGDLGVPATGSGGSHATALGSDYIRFLDDDLTVPNVESDIEIISGEMSVETGLDDNSKLGSARRNIHAAEWTYTVTATLAGSKVSVDQTTNYLTEQTGDIVWTAQEGTITFNDCFIQSPGSYTKESGNAKLQADNEFEAQTITVS